jgi:hypothetical protein
MVAELRALVASGIRTKLTGKGLREFSTIKVLLTEMMVTQKHTIVTIHHTYPSDLCLFFYQKKKTSPFY